MYIIFELRNSVVMSFGGSVQAMINSLKMNRRERKPVFKQEPYQDSGREVALNFGECSKEDRQRLADQLAEDVRVQKRKALIAVLVAVGSLIIIITLLTLLW